MFVRPISTIAGLATLSSAFLIPAAITPIDSVLSLDLATAGGTHIQLDCPGCPVPLKHDDDVGPDHFSATLWGAGPTYHSTLDLDIKVNHMVDSDTITVNNVQIFPLTKSGPLIATQTRTDEEGKGSVPEDINLGYQAMVKLVKGPDEKESLALYKIIFSVVEVADLFVEGIDRIELDVIATPANGLLITDIKKTFSSPSTVPEPVDGTCETMICKLKEAIAAHANRLQEMRPKHKGGCHGKGMKGMHRGYGLKGHHGHVKGEHEHGKHHRHHRFGKFFHNLKNVALQVLIPISIGIATGMTASLLGMIVGHLVVSTWRFFVRGNTRGSCSYANAHREPEHGYPDEKKHFILVEEDEVPLPAYTDEVDEKSELA